MISALSVGGSCAVAPLSNPADPEQGLEQRPQEASGDASSGASEAPGAAEERGFFERILLGTAETLSLPLSDSPVAGGGLDRAPGAVEGGEQEAEDGGLLVAPIPFVNPTIGYGLALGAGYLFKIDEKSPDSVIGGGGMYSENGSFGGAAVFKGYFAEDRYRLTAGFAATRLNFDYSTDSGSIPLRENILGLGVELLVRSFEHVYIGPQLLLSGIDTDIAGDTSSDVIPEDQLQADNLGIGLRAQRDTRDSQYYPRTGSLADLQVRIADPVLGSSFAYQVIPIAYNQFFSPGERDVIAVRASGRFALGDVPFYGESYFGANSDLRGYAVGTYHDDTLLAAQAEYRRELIWRMGAVAFAGLGTVAPSLGELGGAEALPSAGFGLRFELEEKNHINFRIDFAWGQDQSAIYLGVGEAF